MTMAKTATSKSGAKTGKSAKTGTAVARRSSAESRNGGGGSCSDAGVGDAFIKLLQSPLVAELVAVAATAALAALAEHGFTSGDTRGKRAGKAVKEAGKAAAAAVGRRLSNELEEIRAAAKESKAGAKA
jgi:hypothetical protein